ncbi:MAG: hypothetical protein LBK99_03485 [Opitutaceae bacterium]|jgi:hypothetical protein|nr:hypothetical protein [Opitutaceae bacterium]
MGDILVHDERFTEAFANTDHTVYGKRLAPFCLWHQLNLELVNSPLITGDAVTPIDLWAAVKICTAPFSPGGIVPRLNPVRGWRKLVEIWRFSRYDFRKEFSRFEDYLADFQSPPKLWPNHHKGGGQSARDMDEILEAAAHVIHETGWSEETVWMMPIGKLHWYSTAFLKFKGADIMIWTPLDEEAFQEHKKKREARIAARAAMLEKEEGLSPEAARKQAHDEYWARVKKFYANAAAPQPK